MKISLSEGTWDKSNVDIVALAIPSGKTNFNRALGRIEVVTGKGSIKPLASDERFEGKPTQTLKVAAGGKAKSRWLLLVGIGDSKDAQRIAWNLGHALASTAGAQKSGAVELPEVTSESVRAASQGLVAGAYRYTEYKSDKAADSTLGSAVILGARKGAPGLNAAVRAGKAIAERVNFARATRPTRRTKAASPSTFGPDSGTMKPPLPSPAKISPCVARAVATIAADDGPVLTTATEW